MTGLLSRSPAPDRSAQSTGADVLPAGSPPVAGPEGPGGVTTDGEDVGLFRRAVWEGDAAAWEHLVARYRRMVLGWIRQLPASAAVPADDDDRVVRAFERFWLALRFQRLERFANSSALLGYLKLCAASVVLDDARRGVARGTELISLDAFAESAGGRAGAWGAVPDTEARVMAGEARRELWEAVQEVLRDEAERRVVYLRFAIGLTPREIHERHPECYPTVAEVYRIKRNALLRLRRCRQLRPMAGGRRPDGRSRA
jgi:hypothetical protein